MFKVVLPSEPERWQNAVESIEGLDLHYQLEYCRLFAGSGRPELFFYREGDNCVVYPYIKRPISQIPGLKGKIPVEMYDITTPYGFGGPVVSPGGDQRLVQNFYQCFAGYCREKKIITEFTRFHPLLKNHLFCKKQVTLARVSTSVYVDLTRSLEEIWANYERNNRKNIKKACREGLKVLIEEEPNHFEEFLSIYHDTMERNKASKFYYFPRDFYEKIHRNLKNNYIYAHTIKDQKIISTELLLFNERFIHSFLGGTLPEYFIYRPNNILKHEVIKWARARGIKYFLLGGGYSDGDGIFRYKRSFSRDGITDFYVGKKIYNEEAVKMLEQLTASEKKSHDKNYFPPYRR